MSRSRTLSFAVPLALALCFAAPEARAQFPGNGTSTDYVVLSVLLAPPALASLICDIVSVTTLTKGFAYRGSAITGLVFGGVTTLLSFLALAAGVSSGATFEFWVPAGSVGIAFGLGSVLVGIFGLVNPPPEPPPGRVDALPSSQPRARAPGEVSFLPTIIAARGGLGAAGLLTVSL